MGKIFNFRPRVKTGHSFEEYISKYSKGYMTGKLKVRNSIKELENNHCYWEIDKKFYQIDASQHLKVAGISVGVIGVCLSVILPVTMHLISKERYVNYNFKYWNENCTSLQKLQHFVEDSVTPGKSSYIPKADRIATFDMDGTLFGERAPIYIEWMMFDQYFDSSKHKTGSVKVKETRKGIKNGETILPLTEDDEKTGYATVTLDETRISVKEFMKNQKEIKYERTGVGETDKKGVAKTYVYDSNLEMEEANAGALLFSDLSIKNDYLPFIDNFLKLDANEYFTNLKYEDMFYLPMIEVVEFLQVNNFDVYIVSGTDRFMVRDIVNKHITIPSNKVIGMDVSLYEKNGDIYRGNELKYKNVEEVKVELIAQEIGKKPVLSFGNSNGDCAMHNYTLSNDKYKSEAFMIVADDLDREYGYTAEQLKERTKTWGKFNKFSMKNDFKTIYGDNVQKIGK